MVSATARVLLRLSCLAILPTVAALAVEADPAGMDFARLAALRSVREVAISPNGDQVAYVLSVPRTPGEDDDGPAWSELHLVSTGGGPSRPFVSGKVGVSDIAFTPDGKFVTYLAERGDDEEQALWAIPVGGGESRRWVGHDEGIRAYRIAPDGRRVAFVAAEPESDERERIREKGYTQEVFEEDWRPRRVWIAALPPADPPVEDPSAASVDEDADEPRALEIEGSVFGLDWSPDGKRLALAVAPRPLVDDRYVAQRVRVVDVESGAVVGRLDNWGELDDFAFSPDGQHIAMIASGDVHDPLAGRLLVGPADGGELSDLLPGLEGHVSEIAWQDAETVMFVVDEGVETRFGEIGIDGTGSKTHLVSGADGVPVMTRLRLSADGQRAAIVGQRPDHPPEVYLSSHDSLGPRRLTDSNPWLGGVKLARQEVVTWKARDGLELQGLLLHPLGPSAGRPAPLLMIVHGGPESHVRNGWITSYSRPGQLAAGRGYAAFYPNYRGSTGRGVAFSRLGQQDAAGKEFDDLVDAVDHLVEAGIADGDRVGITGGSYGGYATAWCATRYTDHFRAGVMFVGISNKLSKGLTTDIPMEDKLVHTLFDPWTRWEFSLERSPIYYAEQSRTALLIAGGTADTRVHPSQSLQLYRALKLIGKTPVRYVRYPGEGHGNRRAAARDDYARRLIRWMDHFVVERSAELPPWELEVGGGDDEDDE